MHNSCFFQGVSAGGFAGARKQLADAFEQCQQRGVGSKAHDQPLLGEAAEVAHHLLRSWLWVVNEHIQAADGVKGAAQAFEITGEEMELAHGQARLFCAALSLLPSR